MDDEALEVVVGRGTALMCSRAPRVMFALLSGHLEDGIYRALRKFADEELVRHGAPLRAFFDTTAMTGFESAFRQRMMTWQASDKNRVVQMALVKSSLVAVTIAAANRIVGGGVEITSNRARFEKALADAVAAAVFAPAGTRR